MVYNYSSLYIDHGEVDGKKYKLITCVPRFEMSNRLGGKAVEGESSKYRAMGLFL